MSLCVNRCGGVLLLRRVAVVLLCSAAVALEQLQFRRVVPRSPRVLPLLVLLRLHVPMSRVTVMHRLALVVSLRRVTMDCVVLVAHLFV